jgi:flagellar protein FlaF
VYTNALNAYKTVGKATMSGRELEASVLTQAALKLKDCQDNWGKPGEKTKLDSALKYNQKIWTIFQSELAKADNPLPPHLKRDLLSLSAFIDKRIFEIMAYPAPEKLSVVININSNIAAGLRSQPGKHA